MFRLVYDRRPIDLIPAQLRSPEVIDFTEALFGFVRDDDELKQMSPQPKQGEKGRSYAGRVFVGDATLNPGQQDIWLPVNAPDGILEPAILASPKPTSFQHYLTQPNPNDRAASSSIQASFIPYVRIKRLMLAPSEASKTPAAMVMTAQKPSTNAQISAPPRRSASNPSTQMLSLIHI